MTELSGPLLLLVPLLLGIGAAFAWVLSSRPVSPPRLRGYATRQSWQVDPGAILDRDLRAGRLSSGILVARDRLFLTLTDRHHLSPVTIRRRWQRGRRRTAPVLREACRTVRRLESTYGVAHRAEDLSRTDLWSRWRRPAWRERARREFEEEFTEVERVLPRLETRP